MYMYTLCTVYAIQVCVQMTECIYMKVITMVPKLPYTAMYCRCEHSMSVHIAFRLLGGVKCAR